MSKFDIKINLETPYKLCDFKPTYGYIFADEVKPYDFWGHIDTDLILGDIRAFITDDILERYDKILSRGHLSLYRNTPEINMFWRNNSGEVWREALSSSQSWQFDEWGKNGISNNFAAIKKDRFWNEIVFDDINILKKHFIPQQKPQDGKTNNIYQYSNGKLLRYFILNGNVGSEQTLYVHLQKRDMTIGTNNENEYLIVPNCFIENQCVTKEVLHKYGKRRFFYAKYFDIRLANLNRKLKEIVKL